VRAGTSAILIGALCALVFAVQLALELRAGGGVPLLGGSMLVAFRAGSLVTTEDVVRLEPFRFLSAVYVHFGLIHFGLNMLGLFSQAKVADTVVGTARTIIVFVVGGIVGYLATYGVQLVTGAESGPPTAGASGGLLAIMGMILGVMLRRKMPGFLTQAGNVLFYVVIFGFAINAAKSSIMINNSAHIGGLLCGFLFGYLWGKTGAADGPATRTAAIALFVASVASVALALSSNLYKLLAA
jgi:rhomboid protease GluP